MRKAAYWRLRLSELNPVIKHPPAGIRQDNHFRDPNVFFQDGTWYMLVENRLGDNGKILFYCR
ncbi:hypothetical protein ACFQ88_05175 [Paenibacillus sp. NPDC056579]|uniref:hypothetical protein n=1 Tax=Paenibacillus sp. NPDC056579 TaxID=3345871 RepID=UPI0036AD04BE